MNLVLQSKRLIVLSIGPRLIKSLSFLEKAASIQVVLEPESSIATVEKPGLPFLAPILQTTV
jgi:hypothetical protein